MVFLRKFRLNGNRKKYILISIVSYLLLFGYAIFAWNPSCWDFLLDYKISRECERFYSNEQTGNFCTELCAGNSIANFKCMAGNHQPPDSKFLGTKAGKTLLIRAARHDANYEALTWVDRKGYLHYPTLEEFQNLVLRLILLNFNVTLPHAQLTQLLQLKNKNNHVLFHASMQSAWSLIQDQDYLIGMLGADRELFPAIFGHCGSLFFTERLEPLQVQRGNLIGSLGWKYNIKVAVLILDYIEELEQGRPSFVMCDVDVENFGIIDSRMKYSELSHLYSIFFMDRFLSNSKPCQSDSDCRFKNCRSKCDPDSKVCIDRLLNNNLQIVCEKVFKGTPEKPGILFTSKTSSTLKTLIEKCTNPTSKSDTDPERYLGPSTELRQKIYNELANIYESLAI